MTTRGGTALDLLPRLVLMLPVMIAVWLATLALVLRLGAPAQVIFVPFPPDGLVEEIGDVAVLGISPISLTLRSDKPDLAARAYAAGAWLVLPAALENCIPSIAIKNVDLQE